MSDKADHVQSEAPDRRSDEGGWLGYLARPAYVAYNLDELRAFRERTSPAVKSALKRLLLSVQPRSRRTAKPMLESLQLQNVGPAPEMKLELAPRLNLITGDNGLGKTFLLDVAWWALTRRWPQDLNANLTSGYAARPTDIGKKASISFEVETKSGRVAYESPYFAEEQS